MESYKQFITIFFLFIYIKFLTLEVTSFNITNIIIKHYTEKTLSTIPARNITSSGIHTEPTVTGCFRTYLKQLIFRIGTTLPY